MKKAVKIGIPIAVILAAMGGAWSLNLDFSQTNIGQIGDNTFNNIIQQELGIDIEEFNRLCEAGTVHEEFEQYCGLIP